MDEEHKKNQQDAFNRLQLLIDKFDERIRVVEKETVRLNTIWKTIAIMITVLVSVLKF